MSRYVFGLLVAYFEPLDGSGARVVTHGRRRQTPVSTPVAGVVVGSGASATEATFADVGQRHLYVALHQPEHQTSHCPKAAGLPSTAGSAPYACALRAVSASTGVAVASKEAWTDEFWRSGLSVLTSRTNGRHRRTA